MRTVRLLLLGMVHLLADGYAFCVPPLLAIFIVRFHVGPLASTLTVAVMTLGHSVLQPVFGLLSDRHRGWWLTAVGLLAAGAGVAAIGWSPSFGVVLVVVFIAGLGVGAAHPAAVTAAGRLMPHRRGLAVALFLFAGTLGLAIGPLSATWLHDVGGLPALAWVLLPGAAVAVAVMLALPRGLTGAAETAHRPDSLLEELRHTLKILAARRGVLLPLWLMAAVRNLVVIGVVTLIGLRETSGPQQGTTEVVGWPMAVFVFASGVGGVIHSWLRPKRETVMRDSAVLMLVVVPLIVLLPILWPDARGAGAGVWVSVGELACLGVIGGLVAATVPSVTALFQHLVPERENVAATLSMGLAWGAGGLVGPLLCGAMVQWIPGFSGRLTAFGVVGAISLLGGLLAWWAHGRLHGDLGASTA